MSDWLSTLIPQDASVFQAIEVIEKSSLQIAVVVDLERELLGLVTDGDVRRAILQNISFDSPVKSIMHRECITATISDSRETLAHLMNTHGLRHIPIVDEKNCIIDLKMLHETAYSPRRDNWVVLMAGGQGQRLRPLTGDTPKPLLKVGSKPLLENIIENFRKYGLFNFIITLFYKAEMIEEYFGDGSKWGVNISYLREKNQLGTIGAISLLPELPTDPLIVMNGDLLTEVNYAKILDFHTVNKATGTICARGFDYQVPYGVIEVDKHHLVSLKEKPVHSFFVNAGIYVLEPHILNLIPQGQPFDITQLFDELLNLKKDVSVFPIHEYWVDIGRLEDYKRANGEYDQHFPSAVSE